MAERTEKMSKTKYCIRTKELYSWGKLTGTINLKEKFNQECNKRNIPIPDLSHGDIHTLMDKYGIKPRIIGSRKAYIGSDVITFFDSFIKEQKDKNKPKRAEQLSLGEFGIEWFEPEAPAEPTQIPSVEPSEASMEIDPNELRDALMELVRAVHRVADIIGYEGSEI